MKIKTNDFECSKSKPATHSFIFNLSKSYLDHQAVDKTNDLATQRMILKIVRF